MRELEAYTYYMIDAFGTLKKGLNSFGGFGVLVGSMVIGMSGMQKALLVLGIAIVIDFVTGTWASWIEYKNSGEKLDKPYFFESAKVRMSVVKAVSYALLIFFSYIFTVLFFDQPIKVLYSTKTFTAAEIVTGICIAVEFWSLIENTKRAGFDIFEKIRTGAREVWSVVKTIKHNDQ